MNAPEDVALKERFAEAFLRDPEPLRAAMAVIGPADPGRAMSIAMHWPYDPYVIDFQTHLIETHGADHFLPDKLQLAREIWRHAEDCRDPDAKTKALKLYGEVTGILNRDPKSGGNVYDNRTMIIYNQGSDENWEKKMREQQLKLMIEADAT